MTWRTWLKLGRVSNLPTVWSNGLAGWALSGAAIDAGALALLLIALSLFYVAGMYLNDAFDARVDARERAERPIPMGEVGRGTVLALGFAMLALGALIAFALGTRAGLAGVALAGTVVLYDWLHKRTALGPVIMGACRLLSYVTAAFAAGGTTGALWVGAGGLFCHVVGLTYAARQEAYDRIGAVWPLAVMALPVVIGGMMLEGAVGVALLAAYAIWSGWALSLLFRRRPGDVPRAVVSLIAAVSLYDAVMIVGAGGGWLALPAVAAFAATLALQRLVPGT
ncbi:MAG: UbiA family prenyltransferase [Limibaculum sp.]|jgi:4-hydroxybenzoate polyprenyltransferase